MTRSHIRFAPAVLLLATIVTPSLVIIRLNASSMAPGILLVAAVYIFLYVVLAGPLWPRTTQSNRPLITAAALTIVYWHAVGSFMVNDEFDLGRFAQSYAGLVLFVLGALSFGRLAQRLSAHEVDYTLRFVFGVLLVCGVLGVFGFAPFTPDDARKPVVFFSEPSHYALAFLPFLFYMSAIAGRRRRIGVLMAGLAIALLLKSTTMLAGVLLIVMVVYRLRLRVVLLLIAFGVAVANVEYYAARVMLTSDTSNVSALAYLQGWERAFLNLRDTRGYGVGFQQFGIFGAMGEFREALELLEAETLSLYDGASVASKLIGEFGWAGVAILILYVRRFLRGLKEFREASVSSSRTHDPRLIFFMACFIMYSIDLFVRGTGYFSHSGFIFLASLAWMGRPEKKRLHVPELPDGTAAVV